MSKEPVPSEYAKFKTRDPFPEIPPALLNSADIDDYVNVTGMINPYEARNLKPASYEIPFSGMVYWWEAGSKDRQSQEVKGKDDTFVLEPNAIAYICPDTTFYLPDYIALRFNLRITHVHQGLLLGTGPLVDPGFCGRLLIPLHNLTSNKYTFVYGNGFIWVEFTKLSPSDNWSEPVATVKRKGKYVSFREDKTFLNPDFYFDQANKNRPIVSSIPTAMADSRSEAIRAAGEAEAAKEDARSASESAQAAKQAAENAKFRFDRNTILGLFGAAIAGAAILYSTIQIFQNMLESRAKAFEDGLKTQVESFQKEMIRLREDVERASKNANPEQKVSVKVELKK